MVGKCTKSFHVSCALAEGSGILLDATLPEVGGGEVSVLAQTKAVDAPPSPSKTTNAANEAPERVPEIEPEGELKLTILCRTHNPVGSSRRALPSLSIRLTRSTARLAGLEAARADSESERAQSETRRAQGRGQDSGQGDERLLLRRQLSIAPCGKGVGQGRTPRRVSCSSRISR